MVDCFAVELCQWWELARSILIVGRRGAAEHYFLSCGFEMRHDTFTAWGLQPSLRMFKLLGRRSPGWEGWLRLVLLWEHGAALLTIEDAKKRIREREEASDPGSVSR